MLRRALAALPEEDPELQKMWAFSLCSVFEMAAEKPQHHFEAMTKQWTELGLAEAVLGVLRHEDNLYAALFCLKFLRLAVRSESACHVTSARAKLTRKSSRRGLLSSVLGSSSLSIDW